MKTRKNNVLSIFIISALIVAQIFVSKTVYGILLCIASFVLFISSFYSFYSIKKREHRIDIPAIIGALIAITLFISLAFNLIF